VRDALGALDVVERVGVAGRPLRLDAVLREALVTDLKGNVAYILH
jgi:hypothetical protein